MTRRSKTDAARSGASCTISAISAALLTLTPAKLVVPQPHAMAPSAAPVGAEGDAAHAGRPGSPLVLGSSGKKVSGGLHKFDASEVDVHGGNATADDFMDAFGF